MTHMMLIRQHCLQFSSKFTSWTGISIKKWMKEMRRRRKEEKRLRRAEVHAAISVAGLAAALAAIAAEDTEVNKPKSLKEKAVASAAALIAAQCVQVAEAGGAKQDQLASAIDAATTAADAGNIITLTAAAATCIASFPQLFSLGSRFCIENI